MVGPTRPTITTLKALVQRYQDEVYTLAYYLIGDETRAIKTTEAAFEQVYRPDLLAEHFRLEAFRQVYLTSKGKRAAQEPDSDGLTNRLLGLTKDEQAAVVLVDVLGLSYHEAGWVTGCNPKQIEKLLAHGRLRFSTKKP